MRWPRRRRPTARELDTAARDRSGRLYDGDRVRPSGYARWVDLLPVRRVDETTRLLPVLTPARQARQHSGGWQ
jgi:hypothetical protein